MSSLNSRFLPLLRRLAARGLGSLLVAFGFELVHGLGFASGLLALLHQLLREVLLALLGFILGLEVGQQVVLLPLFGLRQAVVRYAPRLATQPAQLAST